MEIKFKRLHHKKATRTIIYKTEPLDFLETVHFHCDAWLLYMKYMFRQSHLGDENLLRASVKNSCKLQSLPSEIMQSKGPVKITSPLKCIPEIPAINNLCIDSYAGLPADMKKIVFHL